jgi:hypothetical protein
LLSLNEPLGFQIPVRAVHRVRVDRDLGHDLTHGGQLIAGLQQAQAHRLPDLVDELTVSRDPGTGVQPESDQRP